MSLLSTPLPGAELAVLYGQQTLALGHGPIAPADQSKWTVHCG